MGHIEVIAEYIKELTGADTFKIEPKVPYSKDYNTCIEKAKERQENHNAPISQEISDFSNYEVIYIGSPAYWSDMPEELVMALNKVDFTGKVIIPFVTHEGSGLANIPRQIKNICQGGEVIDEFVIRGAFVHQTKNRGEEWL